MKEVELNGKVEGRGGSWWLALGYMLDVSDYAYGYRLEVRVRHNGNGQ